MVEFFCSDTSVAGDDYRVLAENSDDRQVVCLPHSLNSASCLTYGPGIPPSSSHGCKSSDDSVPVIQPSQAPHMQVTHLFSTSACQVQMGEPRLPCAVGSVRGARRDQSSNCGNTLGSRLQCSQPDPCSPGCVAEPPSHEPCGCCAGQGQRQRQGGLQGDSGWHGDGSGGQD